MHHTRRAAAAFLLSLTIALAACGSNDADNTTDGEFREEDPTLSEERDGGAGNGEESNQPSDNGSGTGSGRGDE